MSIQAIAFYKPPNGKWTEDSSKRWIEKNLESLVSHNDKDKIVLHETKNMYHYRVKDPKIPFKKFVTKVVGSGRKKILLTIGVADIQAMNDIQEMKGGDMTVFPLRKESGILSKPVISEADATRNIPDRITIQDATSTSIDNAKANSLANAETNFGVFDRDTLLGAMMLPKSKGGIGFPFPTSSSTFSPLDWLSMSAVYRR